MHDMICALEQIWVVLLRRQVVGDGHVSVREQSKGGSISLLREEDIVEDVLDVITCGGLSPKRIKVFEMHEPGVVMTKKQDAPLE